MTPRNSARPTRAMRACVAFFVIILALMNGDRPLGQIATLPNAIEFDGVNDHITFGPASGTAALGVTNFTIELRFRWTGGGVTTSTGTLGLTGPTVAIPLVTKGTGQAETPANLNMNYFLGISGGKLAADFEDTAGGVNHPVIGTATITTNVWHHAAVTYKTQQRQPGGYISTEFSTERSHWEVPSHPNQPASSTPVSGLR